MRISTCFKLLKINIKYSLPLALKGYRRSAQLSFQFNHHLCSSLSEAEGLFVSLHGVPHLFHRNRLAIFADAQMSAIYLRSQLLGLYPAVPLGEQVQYRFSDFNNLHVHPAPSYATLYYFHC